MGKEEVKVLGSWTSPYSWRVELALKLKGIEYEYIEQDLYKKSNLLLQSNPVFRRIPVLLHNGRSIAETHIIFEYIDDTWKPNPILPQDPYNRAVARFWCRFIDEKITFPEKQSMMCLRREKREKAAKEVVENLKALEKQLEGKRFFGGDKFGVVDIAAIGIAVWTPALKEAAGVEEGFGRFPLISSWADEIMSCAFFRDNLPSKELLVAGLKPLLRTYSN